MMRFQAGPVVVGVRGSETFLDGVRALFFPALLPDEGPVAFEYEEREEQLFTRDRGREVLVGTSDLALAMCLEEDLVERLPYHAREWTCLHAGLVVLSGYPVLLVAPSGGGKSTLTHAAVSSGASFVSDDCLFVGSGTLWGLGRTIRFKPVPEGAELPRYLDGFSLEQMQFHMDGENHRVPLWPGPYREVLRTVGASDGAAFGVVNIVRGRADGLRALSRLDRLQLLHQASLTTHRCYSGELDSGQTWELTWNDPKVALAMLQGELEKVRP